MYIGNFEFPDGNAAGKRVFGNVRLLQRIGFKVAVVGVSGDLPQSSGLSEATSLDSIVVRNLPYPSGMLGWLRVRQTYKQVQAFLDHDPDGQGTALVVLYGSPVASVFCLMLIRACRKRKIRVVSDCVDWLSVSTRNPVFNAIKFADNLLQKRIANTMTDGVICISRYLEDYYRRRGKETVVIPPTSEAVLGGDVQRAPDGGYPERTLLYAGKPFRSDMKRDAVESMKDRIDLVLKALEQLKAEDRCFRLEIYGFSESELLDVLPSLSTTVEFLRGRVFFHGQVSSDQVLDGLARADFSILIRDVKRETLSGFPTKVAESIRQGVPVLVTDVGDVREYVRDGVCGLLLPPGDFEAQCAVLRKAHALTGEELNTMKSACLRSQSFLDSTYVSQMKSFLQAIGLTAQSPEQRRIER